MVLGRFQIKPKQNMQYVMYILVEDDSLLKAQCKKKNQRKCQQYRMISRPRNILINILSGVFYTQIVSK